jgi:thymidylate synthase (FAD)
MAKITVDYINHMGDDNTVVDAARVSFDKHSGCYTKQQNTKLIHYLAKHKHISPFGHCFASFKVKAPIFVARQLVKHQYLRWNEISRRYVDDEPEFYLPDVWRGRSADKKQGSDGVVDYGVLTDFYDRCLFEYAEMLDFGVAPEQARMVLPQSTMTEWYWSGSLDAFASMCKLRLKEDTQYESRLVAKQISEVMDKLYPVSWEALVSSSEAANGEAKGGNDE